MVHRFGDTTEALETEGTRRQPNRERREGRSGQAYREATKPLILYTVASAALRCFGSPSWTTAYDGSQRVAWSTSSRKSVTEQSERPERTADWALCGGEIVIAPQSHLKLARGQRAH